MEDGSDHTNITQELTIFLQTDDNLPSEDLNRTQENFISLSPHDTEVFSPFSGLATISTERKKKSPYLTPFTASKIPTPGKYLYYGALKEFENPSDGNSNEPVLRDGDLSILKPFNPQALVVHQLDSVDNCQKFFSFLQKTSFLSFELIFRKIPSHFLDFWRSSGSSSNIKGKESILQGWSSLLTYNYDIGEFVTSSRLDLNLPSPFELSSSKFSVASNPLLLTGISLSFGSFDAFILRLPQVLPLVLHQPLVGDDDPRLTMNQFSLNIKEKICSFIGFPNLLHKSFPLFHYLARGSYPSCTTFSFHSCSNPLFHASKHWCYVTRRSLLLEWRKGGCLEWKLLQEILNSSKITKISFNMKSKLKAFRDRDVFVEGSNIEDPLVAKDILLNSGDVSIPVDEEERDEEDNNNEIEPSSTVKSAVDRKKGNSKKNTVIKYPVTVLPSFLLTEYVRKKFPVSLFTTAEESPAILIQRSYLISSFFAYYSFHCMKVLKKELIKTQQSQLFYKIEMPLLITIANSEYHGIEIASKCLQTIRQQWHDRKSCISSLFEQFFRAPSFNCDSPEDSKKIKSYLSSLASKIYQQASEQTSSNPTSQTQTQLLLSQRDQYSASLSHHHYHPSQSQQPPVSSLSSSSTQLTRKENINNYNVSTSAVISSDWSAGKRKRSRLNEGNLIYNSDGVEISQPSTAQNTQTPFIHQAFVGMKSSQQMPLLSQLSSQSLLQSNQLSSQIISLAYIEKMLENHPLSCLLHEYRSITRTMQLINGILKYRKFGRIHANYHSIGTETGRVIISNPPLQQVPKENNIISSFHPTLYEEMMKTSATQPPLLVTSSSNRSFSGEIINRMNYNLQQSVHTGVYEWVKLIPFKAKKVLPLSSESSYHFYSSELILGKLLFIFPFNIMQQYFISIDESFLSVYQQQLFANRNLPMTQQQQQFSSSFPYTLSSKSYFEEWNNNNYNLYLPNSNSAADLIYQVLIQIPSSSASSRFLSSCTFSSISSIDSNLYVIVPSTHLYRVKGQVGPSSAELELLHRSTVLPSTMPQQVSQLSASRQTSVFSYFQETIQRYQSLSQKQEIRKSFVASSGYVLLAADYSQIELRLLTHFCKDPSLLSAFLSSPSTDSVMKKEDIFERLASIYKRKSIESITKSERNEIKQLCYAVIYGAGPKLIAETMNLSTVNEAQQLITDFYKRFPRISSFMNEIYEESKKKGFVETLFGRKRYLSFDKLNNEAGDNKKEKDWKLVSKLQRQVINTLCQGSAADLVKVRSAICFRLFPFPFCLHSWQ
jgi:hypothetical protein